MVSVRLEGITKKYLDRTVIDNLSIEVGDGEFACLLGPQGAGKTTVLRIIAGLEKPTSGRIYFGEEDVTDHGPGDRNVAMVFQTFALYPHKTVFQNLEFTLMKDKMSKEEREQRIDEIAKLLRMTHLLDKKPAYLSGGEKQRVSMGRALVRKPNLFLLDEPLTNLDAKLRLHMRSELKKIQKEVGQTAIFSTADDIEAITMSDKIAVVNEGRLQQYDEVYAVYDNPRNIFTGKFVGTPTINLVDCKLAQDGEKVFLDMKGQMYDISEIKNDLQGKEIGSDLTLGIRPADITVDKTKSSDRSLSAKVYEMILTGDIYELALDIGGNIFRALVPSTFKASIGDLFWVNFDDKRLHIFDKQTGNSVI